MRQRGFHHDATSVSSGAFNSRPVRTAVAFRADATAERLYDLWGIRGSPFEPTLKTATLKLLFVALYVAPSTRCVAMWLFGAVSDDVERAIVVLDVRVSEPHIFVGVAVSERHGNCRWFKLSAAQAKCR